MPIADPACGGCRRPLSGRSAFMLAGAGGSALRCTRCALTHGALLRRSLGIAAVVGTTLLAINQGDVLLRGEWPSALAWKIPLTYLVPFVVATAGALGSTRTRAE